MTKRYNLKLLILITILIAAGCSLQTNIDKGDYIVGVYSSYLDDEGEFVMIDFDGNLIKTKKLTGRVITSIKEVENNKFSILPIASKIRYLGNFDQLEKIELNAIPVTQDYNNGIHVISYQNNLIENFIEWNDKNSNTKRLDFGEGYLPTIKIHKDSIYVICEIIDENTTFLYEVDINTGNIINDIKLNTPTGHDIEFTENHIVIGSVNHIILIDKKTLQQKNIKTPFADPIKLLIHNNEMIVHYRESNIISFFDSNSLQEKKTIEHGHLVDTLFLREGKIYVSSVDERDQQYIMEYDVETLKYIKKIKVPTTSNYLMDFIVTSFEG